MARRQCRELLVGYEEQLHVRRRDLDPALDRKPLGDIATAGKPLQMVTGGSVTPRVPDDAVHVDPDMETGRATGGGSRGHAWMIAGQSGEFLRRS